MTKNDLICPNGCRGPWSLTETVTQECKVSAAKNGVPPIVRTIGARRIGVKPGAFVCRGCGFEIPNDQLEWKYDTTSPILDVS